MIISLYDLTGNMVRPWRENGFDTLIVDLLHPNDNADELGIDIRRNKCYLESLIRSNFIEGIFAFPPCVDLAVSGARHFAAKRAKNPRFQEEAMELVYIAYELGELARNLYGAFWMIENPISRISSLWRKPDYIFQPYEYAEYHHESFNYYTKKTCLWTSDNFIMPKPKYDPRIEPNDKYIWNQMRYDKVGRSATPLGFAYAVYQAWSNYDDSDYYTFCGRFDFPDC